MRTSGETDDITLRTRIQQLSAGYLSVGFPAISSKGSLYFENLGFFFLLYQFFFFFHHF